VPAPAARSRNADRCERPRGGFGRRADPVDPSRPSARRRHGAVAALTRMAGGCAGSRRRGSAARTVIGAVLGDARLAECGIQVRVLFQLQCGARVLAPIAQSDFSMERLASHESRSGTLCLDGAEKAVDALRFGTSRNGKENHVGQPSCGDG